MSVPPPTAPIATPQSATSAEELHEQAHGESNVGNFEKASDLARSALAQASTENQREAIDNTYMSNYVRMCTEGSNTNIVTFGRLKPEGKSQ